MVIYMKRYNIIISLVILAAVIVVFDFVNVIVNDSIPIMAIKIEKKEKRSKRDAGLACT